MEPTRLIIFYSRRPGVALPPGAQFLTPETLEAFVRGEITQLWVPKVCVTGWAARIDFPVITLFDTGPWSPEDQMQAIHRVNRPGPGRPEGRVCSYCQGHGHLQPSHGLDYRTCEACKGTGRIV